MEELLWCDELSHRTILRILTKELKQFSVKSLKYLESKISEMICKKEDIYPVDKSCGECGMRLILHAKYCFKCGSICQGNF